MQMNLGSHFEALTPTAAALLSLKVPEEQQCQRLNHHTSSAEPSHHQRRQLNHNNERGESENGVQNATTTPTTTANTTPSKHPKSSELQWTSKTNQGARVAARILGGTTSPPSPQLEEFPTLQELFFMSAPLPGSTGVRPNSEGAAETFIMSPLSITPPQSFVPHVPPVVATPAPLLLLSPSSAPTPSPQLTHLSAGKRSPPSPRPDSIHGSNNSNQQTGKEQQHPQQHNQNEGSKTQTTVEPVASIHSGSRAGTPPNSTTNLHFFAVPPTTTVVANSSAAAPPRSQSVGKATESNKIGNQDHAHDSGSSSGRNHKSNGVNSFAITMPPGITTPDDGNRQLQQQEQQQGITTPAVSTAAGNHEGEHHNKVDETTRQKQQQQFLASNSNNNHPRQGGDSDRSPTSSVSGNGGPFRRLLCCCCYVNCSMNLADKLRAKTSLSFVLFVQCFFVCISFLILILVTGATMESAARELVETSLAAELQYARARIISPIRDFEKHLLSVRNAYMTQREILRAERMAELGVSGDSGAVFSDGWEEPCNEMTTNLHDSRSFFAVAAAVIDTNPMLAYVYHLRRSSYRNHSSGVPLFVECDATPTNIVLMTPEKTLVSTRIPQRVDEYWNLTHLPVVEDTTDYFEEGYIWLALRYSWFQWIPNVYYNPVTEKADLLVSAHAPMLIEDTFDDGTKRRYVPTLAAYTLENGEEEAEDGNNSTTAAAASDQNSLNASSPPRIVRTEVLSTIVLEISMSAFTTLMKSITPNSADSHTTLYDFSRTGLRKAATSAGSDNSSRQTDEVYPPSLVCTSVDSMPLFDVETQREWVAGYSPNAEINEAFFIANPQPSVAVARKRWAANIYNNGDDSQDAVDEETRKFYADAPFVTLNEDFHKTDEGNVRVIYKNGRVISTIPVVLSSGIRFVIVQSSKEEYYFQPVTSLRFIMLAVGIISAVAVVIVCAVIGFSVASTIKKIEANMQLASSFQNELVVPTASVFKEIDALFVALDKMNLRLFKTRAFMPQALLNHADDEEEDTCEEEASERDDTDGGPLHHHQDDVHDAHNEHALQNHHHGGGRRSDAGGRGSSSHSTLAPPPPSQPYTPQYAPRASASANTVATSQQQQQRNSDFFGDTTGSSTTATFDLDSGNGGNEYVPQYIFTAEEEDAKAVGSGMMTEQSENSPPQQVDSKARKIVGIRRRFTNNAHGSTDDGNNSSSAFFTSSSYSATGKADATANNSVLYRQSTLKGLPLPPRSFKGGKSVAEEEANSSEQNKTDSGITPSSSDSNSKTTTTATHNGTARGNTGDGERGNNKKIKQKRGEQNAMLLTASVPSGMAGHTLTNRRVSILVINGRGFHDLTSVQEPSTITALSAELTALVAAHCSAEKGVIDTFHGDHFVLSFNATRHNPQGPQKAVRCGMSICSAASALCEHIRQLLRPHDGNNNRNNNLIHSGARLNPLLTQHHQHNSDNSNHTNLLERARNGNTVNFFREFSMGASTGRAVVGHLGTATLKRQSIVGKVYSRAVALEGICRKLRTRQEREEVEDELNKRKKSFNCFGGGDAANNNDLGNNNTSRVVSAPTAQLLIDAPLASEVNHLYLLQLMGALSEPPFVAETAATSPARPSLSSFLNVTGDAQQSRPFEKLYVVRELFSTKPDTARANENRNEVMIMVMGSSVNNDDEAPKASSSATTVKIAETVRTVSAQIEALEVKKKALEGGESQAKGSNTKTIFVGISDTTNKARNATTSSRTNTSNKTNSSNKTNASPSTVEAEPLEQSAFASSPMMRPPSLFGDNPSSLIAAAAAAAAATSGGGGGNDGGVAAAAADSFQIKARRPAPAAPTTGVREDAGPNDWLFETAKASLVDPLLFRVNAAVSEYLSAVARLSGQNNNNNNNNTDKRANRHRHSHRASAAAEKSAGASARPDGGEGTATQAFTSSKSPPSPTAANQKSQAAFVALQKDFLETLRTIEKTFLIRQQEEEGGGGGEMDFINAQFTNNSFRDDDAEEEEEEKRDDAEKSNSPSRNKQHTNNENVVGDATRRKSTASSRINSQIQEKKLLLARLKLASKYFWGSIALAHAQQRLLQEADRGALGKVSFD